MRKALGLSAIVQNPAVVSRPPAIFCLLCCRARRQKDIRLSGAARVLTGSVRKASDLHCRCGLTCGTDHVSSKPEKHITHYQTN